jgi:hypothetical protein
MDGPAVGLLAMLGKLPIAQIPVLPEFH